MLGMSQVFFLVVNVSSGIVWALVHVVPGILLGQGLSFAGELSGRLLVVLLVLLVILGLTGWFIRIASAAFRPYVDVILSRVSAWAKTRKNRPMQRFGRSLSPDNPRSMAIIVFLLLAAACLLALYDLVSGLVVRQAVSNLDVSVATLVNEWRNAPADELMVGLSMLGDRAVVWTVAGAIIMWLLIWRAWRAGILVLLLMLCGEALTLGLGHIVDRSSPVTGPLAGIVMTDGTFPSGHALMAGLVFGILAVLASHAMGRWSKAVVASSCGIVVIAIACSRIYLSADWLSDILGGLLVATVLAAFFGMAIEAIPTRRIRPLGLMGLAMVIFVTAGAVHIDANQDAELEKFTRPSPTQVVKLGDWTSGQWLGLAGRRIDLAGQPEEVFLAQWLGELAPLQAGLESNGWKALPVWTWRNAISYIDAKADISALPPRPLLHQGLKAKLTFTRSDPSAPLIRNVVRVFKTQIAADDAGVTRSVYVISLTSEKVKSSLNLYAMPTTVPLAAATAKDFLAQIIKGSGVLVLAENSDPEKPRMVLRAQP